MIALEGLAQLRKGVVEYCALGLLSTERKYGLELSNELVSLGIIASAGTLYPLLARMAAKGTVRSMLIDNAHGPARRYYEITERGESELREFRAAWPRFVQLVNDATAERSAAEGDKIASIFSRLR